MGRRTVGGLLFTKGGSILLFREDGSRPRAKNCCSRHGCSGHDSVGKAKGKEVHRAAVPNESTPATLRRPKICRNPDRMPPHGSSAPGSISKDAGGSCSETGTRSRDTPGPGRDLLARLKERVNTSRKRSLNRENSPQSPSGLSVCASSPSNSRSVSRPSHRTASRIREADEGANAGADSVVRRNAARRGSERSDDDLLLVEQVTRNQAPSEGFLSGFMARYRSDLQGELSSLDDSMEDPNGYLRFDVGGIEEVRRSISVTTQQ